MHAFVTAAGAGGVATSKAPQAIKYAQVWLARSGAVSDDEQVVDNRAVLLDLAGDDTASARLLDSELHLDPFDPQLLILRGVVAAKLNDNKTALRSLLLATSVNPTDPLAWQDLALVYKRTGDASAAQRAQQKATQLSSAH
jgi:Flp pilus assembly protein TadD